MEVRDREFYDLIARGLENNGISFQDYIDEMFAEKYNKPETPGFDWEPDMQDDFEFKQISATARVYTMATYVDFDSPGPVKHTEGFELGSDKMPLMKHEFFIDVAKIRLHMQALQQFGVFSERMAQSVENLLFESTDMLLGGNYNSLKFQRHQAVSKGQFDIIAENNPQGITGVSIDFHVPGKNRWEIAWWKKDGTLNTGITPLEDLKNKVTYIRQTCYAPVDHIEVNKITWDKFIMIPAVRQSLGYIKNPLVTTADAAVQIGVSLLDDEMKVLVEKYVGAPITIIDSVSVVEKFDKKTRTVSTPTLQSFDENVFVFVPSSRIGTIKAVTPIVINDPAARIAFYDEGRTVITQTFDAYNKVQKISSELTALCVPNVVRQMYYLTVKASK